MNRRRFLQAAGGLALCPICASLGARAETGHWDYSGPKGPNAWGGVCATGQRQSPVDLRGAVTASLPKIQPNWTGARSITNNGHTIEVAAGGSMQLGQAQYQLAQFHFHHPSEHRLNGQSFPMEVHFVHTGAGGRGVVGALLTRGARNAAFAAIVAAMPRTAKASVAAPASINPSGLLPASLSYYSYPGSLTTPTPDCEENVNWMVLASPVEVGADDIAKFGALFANNARPPMPIGSRTVQRSS